MLSIRLQACSMPARLALLGLLLCGSLRAEPVVTLAASERAPYIGAMLPENGYVAELVTAWLWSWALAVPNSSRHKVEAAQFIAWATSKNYIGMVAKNHGWAAIPPGTRNSTYANESYLKAAPFARFVQSAIENAHLREIGMPPGVYRETQFVSIPEFPAIGDQVGLQVVATLKGKQSVRQALSAAQALVTEQMKNSGYLK